VKKHKPLLEVVLKYLIDMDNNSLLNFVFMAFAEKNNKGNSKATITNSTMAVTEVQKLLEIDENIVALEIMFYGYKKVAEEKNKTPAAINSIYNLVINIEEYPPQIMKYINNIHHILEQWHGDPKRIEGIVSFLTKIYKKQLAILEELMQASIKTINQIENFSILLNSQIVTMKTMTKRVEEQRKYAIKLVGSELDKHTLITEIDKNKQQINDISKLEQYAANKVFSTLIKKLKRDQEIFYDKHRFMEEEFKIFLRERYSLAHDSAYSELSVANIYDLLKRIQGDISKEIEFGDL
jgi:hypothetical protein